MPLPVLSPMLATSVRRRDLSGESLLEPKLDGWRALVYVDGSVTVRTRTGRNVTGLLPALQGLADAVDRRAVVLDGELVVGAGTAATREGRPKRIGADVTAAVTPEPGVGHLTLAPHHREHGTARVRGE